MEISTYRRLQAQARRLVRSAEDAEDLVHDTLLAALLAGRHDPAWLYGVLRNQAALAARTSARRRRREALHAAQDEAVAAIQSTRPDPAPLLARLPPAPRRLAVLLLHGLNGEEILWILAIQPTALRQRLTRIRKALAELPPALQDDLKTLAQFSDRARPLELETGLMRRALKAAIRDGNGLGTHDPDGHLLIVHGSAHTRVRTGN